MPIAHDKAIERGKLGGRPRGTLSLVRQMELKQKEIMLKTIYKKTKSLTSAGLSVALGQIFCYKIIRDSEDKIIKHELVEDSKEIEKALDLISANGISEDGNFYYITTKEPDYKAIEMLLNRAYGKPKESLDISGEVQFSLKALAEHRKALEVEAKIVEDDDNIILPPAEQNK